MFDRFNQEAIRVIMLTQEEAIQLGHTQEIGTAFLLLGLIGESQGIAGKVLRSMNVTLKKTRHEVEKIIGRGSGFPVVEIPFSENAKAVLAQALEEAQQLGHQTIRTEHLLLAIATLKQGIAYQVLEILQVDIEQLQAEILAAMSELEIAAYDLKTTPTNDLQELAQELDHLIDQLSETLAIAKAKSEVLKRRIRSRSLTHAEAIDALQKLPSSPEGTEIKERLTELETTIETDSNLTEEDKAEILAQIQWFARLWNVRLDHRIQKITRRSLRILRGIFADLPSDAPQLPTYQQILAAIVEHFQLSAQHQVR